MEKSIDLYRVIHDLISQIPEGMVTTSIELAEALGDRGATLAVAEALEKNEFRYTQGKVVNKANPRLTVFRDFSSNYPLRSLAELQESMAKLVVQEDVFGSAELFAGADVAYGDDRAFAACVVLDSELRVEDSSTFTTEVRFPYIPGYLAFREGPAIEAVARKVKRFDVLMVNGHGVAHPKGCGIASCAGLELDVPTVGVASRLLVGRVGSGSGDWEPILYAGGTVGARVKREGYSPIYVSVGHKISLETAVKVARGTQVRGGMPEPLRIAHEMAIKLKRRKYEAT